MTVQVPITDNTASLEYKTFLRRIAEAVNVMFSNGLPRAPAYTVATVPSASVNPGALIYVSDAGGNGPCLAFSDGSNWKRCDDASATVTT